MGSVVVKPIQDSRSCVLEIRGDKELEDGRAKIGELCTGRTLRSEESDLLMLTSRRRRSTQMLTENIVHEEFSRDVHQFYVCSKSGTVLGSGQSGTVRVCIHRQTNMKYAIKELSKATVNVGELRMEIRYMAQLDHPNILRMHECFETTDKIYLILDLCTGGDLLTRLNGQRAHHFDERSACKLVQTIVGAIHYCHQHRIVHRDLKLENLIFVDETPTSELKLIDFGLSGYLKDDEPLTSPVGTPYYVAPEVMQGEYDEKCDVWSIGVIAYMTLSGRPPFDGKTAKDILRAVRVASVKFQHKVFNGVSDEAISFIRACLTKDISARPSVADIMTHPWFQLLRKSGSTSSLVSDLSSDSIDRIRAFEQCDRITRLCMEVVSYTLSAGQTKHLQAEFAKVDPHGTGEVSFEQFHQALQRGRHQPLSEEDSRRLFAAMDFDHSGVVQYHEFIAATMTAKDVSDSNLHLAFERLSHHNEFFTTDDVKELLGTGAAAQDVDGMMRGALMSPTSARVTFDQFQQIVHKGLGISKEGILSTVYKNKNHSFSKSLELMHKKLCLQNETDRELQANGGVRELRLPPRVPQSRKKSSMVVPSS